MKVQKPTIVQQFDYYKDREYYKVIPGFLFNENKMVRADRIEDYVMWACTCDTLPDVVVVNGVDYQLIKKEK